MIIENRSVEEPMICTLELIDIILQLGSLSKSRFRDISSAISAWIVFNSFCVCRAVHGGKGNRAYKRLQGTEAKASSNHSSMISVGKDSREWPAPQDPQR